MKKATTITLLLAGMLGIFIACNNKGDSDKATAGTATISKDSMVKRGQYLVSIMGCDDCHSPKSMGPRGPEVETGKRLSGHPATLPLGKVEPSVLSSWVLFNFSNTATVGPWGVSFSSNLTSDATGIGNWTEQQFFTALREGKSKGLDNARPLLPPMPWPNYAKASDEDLRAIFAFLKSTPPVKNVVPAPVPPDRLAKL